VDGVGKWELKWRRNFFLWAEQILRELEEVVGSVVIAEAQDKWIWKQNGEEDFVALDSLLLPGRILSQIESFAFKFFWKAVVPSKVSALVWQVFLDRISTKENLCRRGILQNDATTFVFCGDEVETSHHLFLHCCFTADVRYKVCRWLGLIIVIPPEAMMSYDQLTGCCANKRMKRGYSIVWLAFIWVIWKNRNERIFNSIVGTVEAAVDLVNRILAMVS
jgi:hypothetical protein